MDHLSSCYFCGTAVDAPLGEYPVVPRELDPAPEHQTKIVLCSTCRRKLARVVGHIVETVEDRRSGGPDPAPDPAPDDAADGGADATSPESPGAGGESGPPEPDDDAQTASTEGDDPPTADDPSDDLLDSVSVSALEYNKVMRLLQNREFPVERAEVEAVATSAYDLSIREVNAVIDAAIERGLLREAEGELRRPDGD